MIGMIVKLNNTHVRYNSYFFLEIMISAVNKYL